MFWIALELSIPKIGLNIMLSLTVKKLDAFKFDGVAECDNTDNGISSLLITKMSIRTPCASLMFSTSLFYLGLIGQYSYED